MSTAKTSVKPKSPVIEEPLVKFENVQKSYDGEILVVKDFNLDVAPGEFVDRKSVV